MPPEEKHKINCWISESLWKQVENLGYDSPTKATVAAFEALVLQEEKGSDQETLGSTQEEILPKMEKQLEEAQRQIKASEEKLKAAPDLGEFSRLQARSEELERHNETLMKELKMNDEHQQKRIEDLKSHIYSLDNQMRTKDDQIEKLNENMHKQAVHLQTLLNQKAIEAPGAKKPFWKFW